MFRNQQNIKISLVYSAGSFYLSLGIFQPFDAAFIIFPIIWLIFLTETISISGCINIIIVLLLLLVLLIMVY